MAVLSVEFIVTVVNLWLVRASQAVRFVRKITLNLLDL
jgi:hypothetical protein